MFSSFLHFGSQDFIMTLRYDFPNDNFWRISTGERFCVSVLSSELHSKI